MVKKRIWLYALIGLVASVDVAVMAIEFVLDGLIAHFPQLIGAH